MPQASGMHSLMDCVYVVLNALHYHAELTIFGHERDGATRHSPERPAVRERGGLEDFVLLEIVFKA